MADKVETHQDLMLAEETAAPPAPAQNSSAFLAVVERIAQDPNIDVAKVQSVLDMQERVMAKEAEMAFNRAMARLQPKLPVIKKNSKAHNSKYAKYEHIDAKIRPLYSAEGFSISFTSKRQQDGSVTYYAHLNHVDGHSVTAEISLDADTSGSKNSIQARGSSVTYAKRYLVCMLFNIVTADEDDDGVLGADEVIDEEQVQFIQKLLEETDTDTKQFCDEFAKVESLASIMKSQYPRCKNALINKKQKQQAEPETPQ